MIELKDFLAKANPEYTPSISSYLFDERGCYTHACLVSNKFSNRNAASNRYVNNKDQPETEEIDETGPTVGGGVVT